MSAAAQSGKRNSRVFAEDQNASFEPQEEPIGKGFADNPLYDTEKMMTAVEHSNKVTRTYGIEVMSINIISATPCDAALTKSLACGAVASAEALQAETAARGTANAVRISAEAQAEKSRIESQGNADSEIIRARADGEAVRIKAESDKQAVGRVVEQPGGREAMVQRLAEQYVTELPEMAKA